jgi:hypothetical protein
MQFDAEIRVRPVVFRQESELRHKISIPSSDVIGEERRVFDTVGEMEFGEYL